MTQTLTTERLKDLTFHRSKLIFPASHEEAAAMARELLANREAQPVVGECDPDVYRNGKSVCLVAIPKETAEVICRGISEATGCKVDWHYIGGRVHIKALTPPAPAVPESMPEIDRGEGGSDIDYMQPQEIYDMGKTDGWNGCRAAMLAQPVSQGYKLNSPEIPDGCQWTFDEHDSKWDSGCGEAWMFCDGGPTENGVKFCQNCGNPVLLAAAPEGGST